MDTHREPDDLVTKALNFLFALFTQYPAVAAHTPEGTHHDRPTEMHCRAVATAAMTSDMPQEVIAAAVLHDAGKFPMFAETGKYHKHDAKSGEMLEAAGFPALTCELARVHMYRMNSRDLQPKTLKKMLVKAAEKAGVGPKDFFMWMVRIDELDAEGFSEEGRKIALAQSAQMCEVYAQITWE